MRNLKKILALVLALVMSLSLMATASAADFSDKADIDAKYQTATDVLEGLKVFKGYSDGTFQPKGTITRGEVAAIIYRIVTGDVDDAQVSIYADYNKFDDVPSNLWSAGYINYCANAEIIKGESATKFNPEGRISGYAALAMILRAIGYTANGGFTGENWAVQAAATAEQRDITKNILTGTLGENATRETVAEILFQAMLVPMVKHNIQATEDRVQGYYLDNQTLGQKTFGLEKLSGVVLANEWANLKTEKVIAEDTTEMLVTGIQEVGATAALGDKITLDEGTPLSAVGMTYDAYVAGKNASKTSLVLTEGDNIVADNEGKGVNNNKATNPKATGTAGNQEWASIGKLAETKSLKTDADTEWFINYSDKWFKDVTSDSLIRYVVKEEGLAAAVTVGFISADEQAAYIKYLTTKNTASYKPVSVTGVDGKRIWTVTIQPEVLITEMDQDIMQDIFYTANRSAENEPGKPIINYEIGEVYVGTTSVTDYSDIMNWVEFTDKYFNYKTNTEKFDYCEIGNSLRLIDNDCDYVAEYVLRVDYEQDKVVGTYKNDLLCNNVALADYPEGNLRYSPDADELTQGTIVNYTRIDKKLSIWKADIVTDSINTKNFSNITVTTASGETYGQSGIDNHTKLDQDIMQMAQNTPYNMYLDEFGYIRSYELAQGSKYALLTEMYPTTDRNGNYIKDFQAVAEVKIGDADLEENIAYNYNPNGNVFFNSYIWTWGIRGWFNVGSPTVLPSMPSSYLNSANYLQPAVAHLGIVGSAVPEGALAVNTGYTDNKEEYRLPSTTWNRAVADMQTYPVAPATTLPNGVGGAYGVFDYGPEAYPTISNTQTAGVEESSFSFTNVAAYLDNDGTLTLNSASKLQKSPVDGAQIYRVSTKAATGTGNADITKLYGQGTKAQLIAAYDAYILAGGTPVKKLDTVTSLTTGKDWFDYFTSSALQDGNGIYPVYAEDYVHLDLKRDVDNNLVDGETLVVKPGVRHYHVADNYNTLYNTNGNRYVDATNETEFYIVLPGAAKNIMYKVGYGELPNIKANEIRAAYAVAHNTSAQNNNQDYWVADVIVIETTTLAYDYDSIGLAYYNPYEQSGYIRYADSLNNQWKTLQPSYDGQAQMGMVPQGSLTGLNLTWGNASWNYPSYGFYKLYQTEWAEPNQLTVGDAQIISKDFNKYGIYAGTVTRLEDLTSSGYLDVSTKNTGLKVDTYAIDMNYAEVNEVPVYRIVNAGNGFAAVRVWVNPVEYKSDVKLGDRIIWVYNKAQTELAFVVVVEGTKDDTIPGWLGNVDGLYATIIADQNTGAPTETNIAELLKQAKALDEKIIVPVPKDAAELQKMVKDLENAKKTMVMSADQAAELNTLLASLGGKALNAAKAAALNAAQALADKALLDADVGSLNSQATPLAAVNTALTTLKGAITACQYPVTTASKDITNYYNNGLVTAANANASNAGKNLKDAVDAILALTAAKKTAISVIDNYLTANGVTAATVTATYTPVITAIKACTKITTDPAGLTDVEYYVKGGAMQNTTTTGSTMKALADAVAAAAGTADLTAATKAVKDKADALLAGYEGIAAVGSKVTDLKNAVDTWITSTNGTLSKAQQAAVLNAIAADWDAATMNAPAIATAYQAVVAAQADAADQVAENEKVEEEVVPAPVANPEVPAGGKPYADAYTEAGITISANSDAISVNTNTFNTFIANANGMYSSALITMRPHNAGGVIAGAPYLVVGTSFKAPEGAAAVRILETGANPATSAQLAGIGSKSLVVPGAGSDFRTNGYVNMWTTVARGTNEATGSGTTGTTIAGCQLSNVQVVGNYTAHVYLQFYKDASGTQALGDVVAREITVSFTTPTNA